MGLTHDQSALLGFISRAVSDTGVARTFAEMMTLTGVKSKSNIHRKLKCLEERGHIRRLKGQARAIELITRNTCPHCFKELSPASPPAGGESQRANVPQHQGSLGTNSQADKR